MARNVLQGTLGGTWVLCDHPTTCLQTEIFRRACLRFLFVAEGRLVLPGSLGICWLHLAYISPTFFPIYRKIRGVFLLSPSRLRHGCSAGDGPRAVLFSRVQISKVCQQLPNDHTHTASLGTHGREEQPWAGQALLTTTLPNSLL